MYTTPVLFAPFARPDYARKTFEAIRKAKPVKLYFYSDKARAGNHIELERNNQVRSLINEIDWDCELKTFLREENVGCVQTSLMSAFDWIFENEEEAIILEEDCVPSLAFFDFSEQLLRKYKNDSRIWVISGNNFNEGYNPHNYDYFYSYFPFLWGWATWRDRWQRLIRNRIPYEKIKEYNLYDQIYYKPSVVRQALEFTRRIADNPSWDSRFTISMKCNGGLGIIPKVNLVSNIGIIGANNRGYKTTYHNKVLPDFDSFTIKNPPPFIVSDFGYSKNWFKRYYNKRIKVIQKFVKMFKDFVS